MLVSIIKVAKKTKMPKTTLRLRVAIKDLTLFLIILDNHTLVIQFKNLISID